MNDHSENTDIKVVAIDLAKNSFQLHGVDANGYTRAISNSERIAI